MMLDLLEGRKLLKCDFFYLDGVTNVRLVLSYIILGPNLGDKEWIRLLRAIPLPVQVEMIFADLQDELCGLSAGTVFLQICNEKVAEFGVRHRLESRMGQLSDGSYPYGTVCPEQAVLFREMATELAGRKTGSWGMGTVSYKFAIKRGALNVSVHYSDSEGDCLVE